MHYRNGREAKVGDLVVGKTYNRKGLVAGTLLSLTPGPDQCSALVGFLRVNPISTPTFCSVGAVAVQGTEHHGHAGPLAETQFATDYTEAGLLWHADDAYYINGDLGACQPPA